MDDPVKAVMNEQKPVVSRPNVGLGGELEAVMVKTGIAKHVATDKGAYGAVYMAGKLRASKKGGKKKTSVIYENLLQAQMKMKLSDSEGVSIIKVNIAAMPRLFLYMCLSGQIWEDKLAFFYVYIKHHGFHFMCLCSSSHSYLWPLYIPTQELC